MIGRFYPAGTLESWQETKNEIVEKTGKGALDKAIGKDGGSCDFDRQVNTYLFCIVYLSLEITDKQALNLFYKRMMFGDELPTKLFSFNSSIKTDCKLGSE